jgi:hypothetical protein
MKMKLLIGFVSLITECVIVLSIILPTGSTCDAQIFYGRVQSFSSNTEMFDATDAPTIEALDLLFNAGVNSSDRSTGKKMLAALTPENGGAMMGQVLRLVDSEKNVDLQDDARQAMLRILQTDELPDNKDFWKLYVREIIHPGVKDYSELTVFSHLRKLVLPLHPYINSQLKHLEKLTELETLVLPALVDDTGLAQVAKIKSLRTLIIDQNQITDKGLEVLAGMEQLRLLDLSKCERVTGTGLKHLSSLPHLATLALPSRINPEVIPGFANFQCLESIQFHAAVDSEYLLPLRDAGKLKTLSWPKVFMSTEQYWELTSKLSPIKIMVQGMIDFAQLTDSDGKLLEEAAQDQVQDDLNVLGQLFSQAELGGMQAVPLDITSFNGPQAFQDAHVRCLNSLTQLNWLELQKTSVTDRGLSEFKHYSQLSLLHLPKDATDRSLELLTDCNWLEELRASPSQITDEGVTELVKSCRSIRRIWLPKHVTDASIPALLQLKNLQNICFIGSDVSADAVSKLMSLPPLISIVFDRCYVPEDDQDQLKRDFPFVQIVFANMLDSPNREQIK